MGSAEGGGPCSTFQTDRWPLCSTERRHCHLAAKKLSLSPLSTEGNPSLAPSPARGQPTPPSPMEEALPSREQNSRFSSRDRLCILLCSWQKKAVGFSQHFWARSVGITSISGYYPLNWALKWDRIPPFHEEHGQQRPFREGRGLHQLCGLSKGWEKSTCWLHLGWNEALLYFCIVTPAHSAPFAGEELKAEKGPEAMGNLKPVARDNCLEGALIDFIFSTPGLGSFWPGIMAEQQGKEVSWDGVV